MSEQLTINKCPFDSGNSEIKQKLSRWFVQCANCGCRINSRSCKKDAIHDWNNHANFEDTHWINQ